MRPGSWPSAINTRRTNTHACKSSQRTVAWTRLGGMVPPECHGTRGVEPGRRLETLHSGRPGPVAEEPPAIIHGEQVENLRMMADEPELQSARRQRKIQHVRQPGLDLAERYIVVGLVDDERPPGLRHGVTQ